MTWDDVDRALGAAAERAFDVLGRLVGERNIVGEESGAQEVLAAELAGSGFDVRRLAIPDSISDHPSAGIPQLSYAGRYDLVATRSARNQGNGRSLVVNGHIDVVPAGGTAGWSGDPFVARRADGWLYGRGAGDMKGGFAAGLLALWALDSASPGWQGSDLTVVSVIEEECTGNGTLASVLAGHTADAALLLEPTDLDILLGGVGIIWVDIEISGRAGHAEAAQHAMNPVSVIPRVLESLQALEREINAGHSSGSETDAAFAALTHPYNVNVGSVQAGDWPSSVPAVARLRVRVAFPRAWSAADAFARVDATLTDACRGDEWLATHPPRLRLSGYRAEGYALDRQHPLAEALAVAHEHVHGLPPARVTIGSTTDARYYLHQGSTPAVAYGPRTRNIHGGDEAVDLASIVDCARTVARFLAGWMGGAAL